jgi:hypothetical protein
MRTTVAIFAIIGAAAALPGILLAGRDVKPWVAPGPDDSRGPCPGMNTLANHGYLYASIGPYISLSLEALITVGYTQTP